MTLFEKAYAKINLYLDVGAPRADGFHNIVSVMQSVSLSDDLFVRIVPSDSVEVTTATDLGEQIPSDKNLATKAARLFLESIGGRARVNINIKKKIPAAAGLGGGSSDAAATLRALNRAFDNPVSHEELLALSATLGSDVPFCLLGGTALCEGRGEIIRGVYDPAPLCFVISVAEESVSTPWAYAELDRLYGCFDGSVPKSDGGAFFKMSAYLAGGELPRVLYNVFESAVLGGLPAASEIKKRLLSLGARAALMSGSGPSVFGVFDSESAARAALSELAYGGVRAFFARTV